jgi:hypothetical protein
MRATTIALIYDPSNSQISVSQSFRFDTRDHHGIWLLCGDRIFVYVCVCVYVCDVKKCRLLKQQPDT